MRGDENGRRHCAGASPADVHERDPPRSRRRNVVESTPSQLRHASERRSKCATHAHCECCACSLRSGVARRFASSCVQQCAFSRERGSERVARLVGRSKKARQASPVKRAVRSEPAGMHAAQLARRPLHGTRAKRGRRRWQMYGVPATMTRARWRVFCRRSFTATTGTCRAW